MILIRVLSICFLTFCSNLLTVKGSIVEKEELDFKTVYTKVCVSLMGMQNNPNHDGLLQSLYQNLALINASYARTGATDGWTLNLQQNVPDILQALFTKVEEMNLFSERRSQRLSATGG